MNKAFKFRLYPNKKQIELLNRFFGCNRFVYNYFLDKQIISYENDGIFLPYQKMASMLASMKRQDEYSFLQEVDSISLQQSLKHLDDAFNNFNKYKKVRFPKYKNKKSNHYSYSSICVNNNIKIFDGKIKMPKIGEIKMIKHRHIPSHYIIKSATVSKNSDDKYFVSILFEYENQIIPVDPSTFIGLDYSMHHLYVDDQGNVPDYPFFLKTSENRLKKEQRKLSRMVAGSNNYYKQKSRLSRIHSHITNQRKDYLHKESRRLSNYFDLVAIEDLEMKAIVKNDETKYLHFNKYIEDNGWNLFTSMLNYKLTEQGKVLIKINKYFPSSQKCSCCGSINKALKDFSIKKWKCPICGQIHDRDTNAAINIKEEGKRLFFEKYNRGAHGDSSFMLDSLCSSSEKHLLK